MSIRWRENGDLICAAMSSEQEGDTYINDRLHYQLTVISKAVIADINHENNGLWHWVHTDSGEFLRASKEV